MTPAEIRETCTAFALAVLGKRAQRPGAVSNCTALGIYLSMLIEADEAFKDAMVTATAELNARNT